MVGAIVASGQKLGYPAYMASVLALARALPPTSVIMSGTHAEGKLITWNDMPERTQADVLALFDSAIVRLEETT
jgi:hypothetical protein